MRCSLNQIIYEFNIVEEILQIPSTTYSKFEKLQSLYYKETIKAIIFANIVAKGLYDTKHGIPKLNAGDLVFLKLYKGYNLLVKQNKKLLV